MYAGSESPVLQRMVAPSTAVALCSSTVREYSDQQHILGLRVSDGHEHADSHGRFC